VGRTKETFNYEIVGDSASLPQQERVLNPFSSSHATADYAEGPLGGARTRRALFASGPRRWPGARRQIRQDLSIGGQAIYTERPTLTYVPMTGEKFLRGLITPIDPKNIFFMLQSGYAADFILGLTVESLNGVRNRSAAGGAVREADPEFLRALALMRHFEDAGKGMFKIG
jgi:hypothetical protein